MQLEIRTEAHLQDHLAVAASQTFHFIPYSMWYHLDKYNKNYDFFFCGRLYSINTCYYNFIFVMQIALSFSTIMGNEIA